MIYLDHAATTPVPRAVADAMYAVLTEQFLYLGGEATAGHLCEDRTDVFFGGNRLGRFCRSFGGLAAEHLRKGVSRIVNSDSRSSQVSDRGIQFAHF